MLPKLNFPSYTFRLKNKENKALIFAALRKKFVVLTPEEWVRQHTLQFLIQEKSYPASLLNAEKKIDLKGVLKRYDIVGFQSDGAIRLIVECKAPTVKITQKTFDQIARYNLALKADLLMLTNGLEHYFCKIDYTQKSYIFLKDLPKYSSR